MRKFAAVIAMAAAATLTASPALAGGPSGSTESGNQVTCGSNSQVKNVSGYYVYVGANGVEGCNQSGPGLQGRVIVSTSGYGSIDGDANNPTELQGYARADGGGITCGTGDSTTKENPDACG